MKNLICALFVCTFLFGCDKQNQSETEAPLTKEEIAAFEKEVADKYFVERLKGILLESELPIDVPRWTGIQYNNSGYNLYNRVAANSLQVAFWKIPSDDECNSLINYVNKEPSKIISKGVSGLEIALCGIWEAYSKTLSFSGIEGSIWCGAGYNFMRITNPEMSVSSVQTPHGNSYGYSVRLVRAPEFKYY